MGRAGSSPKPRRWTCPQHGCVAKNDPAKRTCAGCGERRRTTATGHRSTAEKMHRLLVRPPGTPCFNCGGMVGVQDAHIIGKGQGPSPAVMWHPLNGIPLCEGPGSRQCHKRFDTNLIDRDELILRFLGPKKWAELKAAAQIRWNRDWVAVKKRLEAQLAAAKEIA